MYTLQFDGLFQRLPSEGRGYSGIMCYGWVILKDGRTIRTGMGGYTHYKLATSNGAEYLALISGLEALVELGIHHSPVLIQGDSKTTIEQMQKQALTHSPRIQLFHRQARKLCRQFDSLEWCWTPRQLNHPADRLTKQALDRIRTGYPTLFNADVSTELPVDVNQGLHPIFHDSSR
jgi:ribonuclease HI